MLLKSIQYLYKLYRSKYVRIEQIWDRGMHTKKPLMFPHGKLLNNYIFKTVSCWLFIWTKKMWKSSGSMKGTRLEIGNHRPERCRHVPYTVTAGPTEQVGRWAFASPDFGRSVNSIPTRGADYAQYIIICAPPPYFQTIRRFCS